MANTILITAHLFVDLQCPHNFITYLSAFCRSLSLYGYIKLLYVYYTSFNVDSKMPKCGHLILLNISYMSMHIVTNKYFCFNNTFTFCTTGFTRSLNIRIPNCYWITVWNLRFVFHIVLEFLEVVGQWADRQTIIW